MIFTALSKNFIFRFQLKPGVVTRQMRKVCLTNYVLDMNQSSLKCWLPPNCLPALSEICVYESIFAACSATTIKEITLW
jgi:hypothetical protein